MFQKLIYLQWEFSVKRKQEENRLKKEMVYLFPSMHIVLATGDIKDGVNY